MLLVSDSLLILRPVNLLTPLLQFPFLAFIHMFALLVILPNILFSDAIQTQRGRVAIALIISGGTALVIGFLAVPRSLVSSESGLMILLGFWLIKESIPKQEPKQEKENRYWIRLGFIGLVLTALTGIILGLTLFRPTIDPIPFQAIEIHLLVALAFTLSTLRMTFPSIQQKISKGIRTAVLYNFGIVVLFSIPVVNQKWHPALIALIFLFTGLNGIHPSPYKKTPLLMIGGSIVLLAAPAWTSIEVLPFSFFLLAWLYSLSSPIFPGGFCRLTANFGFLFILFGLWNKAIQLIGIGIGLHVFAVGAVFLSFYQNFRNDRDHRHRPPNYI